jgi:hypothetical protein
VKKCTKLKTVKENLQPSFPSPNASSFCLELEISSRCPSASFRHPIQVLPHRLLPSLS